MIESPFAQFQKKTTTMPHGQSTTTPKEQATTIELSQGDTVTNVEKQVTNEKKEQDYVEDPLTYYEPPT